MSASPRFSSGPDDLHVWWIDLDLDRIASDAAAVLSADERARAERFRRPCDRVRWTSARVALRQILARYTGERPEDLRLAQGISGKPALAAGLPPRFSLAHASERAALAVAWERDVGIDLEPVDAGLDVVPLLAVVCSQTERACLAALPPAARLERFLTYWTLKEAYLKGIGAGLSRDPREVETELLADGRAAVRDTLAKAQGAHWTVRLLDAGPGWLSAVAIAGQEPSVSVTELRWPLPEIAPVTD